MKESSICCPNCGSPVVYQPNTKRFLICPNNKCPNYVVYKIQAEFEGKLALSYDERRQS